MEAIHIPFDLSGELYIKVVYHVYVGSYMYINVNNCARGHYNSVIVIAVIIFW